MCDKRYGRVSFFNGMIIRSDPLCITNMIALQVLIFLMYAMLSITRLHERWRRTFIEVGDVLDPVSERNYVIAQILKD